MPSTTGAAGARLPSILGWDLAGSVVALGAGVTQFALGEAVYGMPRFPGEAKACSEYTAVPVSDLTRKPERLTYQEAAAVPMAALIAWQALIDTAGLHAGQTVLIPGGAGGVGHLAIQLAKWKGAQVITTTSTRNVAFVRELGADLVIDYTRASVADVVQEVDVVLDMMGEDLLRKAFEVVKRGGRVVSLLRAQAAGLAARSAGRRALCLHPGPPLRGAAGRPHLVYVFFLWDGEHILIWSRPTSQKIRNVQHNSHVTLGLDDTKNGEAMVILEGKAELLHDPAVNPTLPAFAAKYVAELQRVSLTAEAMAAAYSQALRITPIRFFHRQGTREQRVEVIT